MRNQIRILSREAFKSKVFTKILSTSSQIELKSYDDLPGPKSYPIVGNLFSLKGLGGDLEITSFDKFVKQMHEKYGDLVKFSMLNNNEIYTYKAEHVKIIFQAEDSIPIRPVVDPWQVYSDRKKYAPGLINSQGEEWKKQRSASNQIVAKPKSVTDYLDVHNNIIDEFIQIINKKVKSTNSTDHVIIEKFDLDLKYLNIEMMSIVAFDHRLDCINSEKRQPIIKELIEKIEEYSYLTVNVYYSLPLWKYYRTKKWVEFEKVSDFIFEFTRKYVEESYNLVKNNQLKSNHTMLQQYLINKDKSNLNFEEIVSIMSEFLLAGFDTTSSTLHWLLYRIGTNPHIQDRLYREIAAIYPQNNYIDEDTLSKIPFLKACVKESQRMNSIAPTSGRVIKKDIVLDGYLIPKNTKINIGSIIIAYSDKYFKNPYEFNPDRWLKENNKTDPINPFSSLPFGFGARMCIGRRLAEQKMYLTLIKLIKNFQIEYVGEKAKSRFRLIDVPDFDLKLKFTPRS